MHAHVRTNSTCLGGPAAYSLSRLCRDAAQLAAACRRAQPQRHPLLSRCARGAARLARPRAAAGGGSCKVGWWPKANQPHRLDGLHRHADAGHCRRVPGRLQGCCAKRRQQREAAGGTGARRAAQSHAATHAHAMRRLQIKAFKPSLVSVGDAGTAAELRALLSGVALPESAPGPACNLRLCLTRGKSCGARRAWRRWRATRRLLRW